MPFILREALDKVTNSSLYFNYMCRIFGHIYSFYVNLGKNFGVGVKIIKDSPTIFYLMFGDDCLIFGEQQNGPHERLNTFWNTKQRFRSANQLHKSTIQFSEGVDKEVRNETTDILQITPNSIGTYLGLNVQL